MSILGGFYKKCGRLLGQSSVTATSAYLGVSDNSALELARSINVWGIPWDSVVGNLRDVSIKKLL